MLCWSPTKVVKVSTPSQPCMATQLFNQPSYLETFGLKEPPYSTNPDERFLYLTDNP